MPLLRFGDPYTVEYDQLHELARWTAEKIREEEREEERKFIARNLRRIFDPPNHNPYATGSIYMGSYDDEEMMNEDGEYLPGKFVLPCRNCLRKLSPMLSQSLVSIGGGWEWCGISHQEPYSTWFFACGWCGTPMYFKLVTPQ